MTSNNAWVSVNNDFCHSWGDTAMIFTSDLVTHKQSLSNHLTSDEKSLLMLTSTLFFISSNPILKHCILINMRFNTKLLHHYEMISHK